MSSETLDNLIEGQERVVKWMRQDCAAATTILEKLLQERVKMAVANARRHPPPAEAVKE